MISLHFVNTMSRFGSPARMVKSKRLYENKRGTGFYPWQRDKLIEMTFPQVLDRIVDEFPDQYAFKYTTLNYTRTYSEFRDDVDEFARALISLGVRPGSHVAIWATNLPQWYLTFWATTKIGARTGWNPGSERQDLRCPRTGFPGNEEFRRSDMGCSNSRQRHRHLVFFLRRSD